MHNFVKIIVLAWRPSKLYAVTNVVLFKALTRPVSGIATSRIDVTACSDWAMLSTRLSSVSTGILFHSWRRTTASWSRLAGCGSLLSPALCSWFQKTFDWNEIRRLCMLGSGLDAFSLQKSVVTLALWGGTLSIWKQTSHRTLLELMASSVVLKCPCSGAHWCFRSAPPTQLSHHGTLHPKHAQNLHQELQFSICSHLRTFPQQADAPGLGHQSLGERSETRLQRLQLCQWLGLKLIHLAAQARRSSRCLRVRRWLPAGLRAG